MTLSAVLPLKTIVQTHAGLLCCILIQIQGGILSSGREKMQEAEARLWRGQAVSVAECGTTPGGPGHTASGHVCKGHCGLVAGWSFQKLQPSQAPMGSPCQPRRGLGPAVPCAEDQGPCASGRGSVHHVPGQSCRWCAMGSGSTSPTQKPREESLKVRPTPTFLQPGLQGCTYHLPRATADWSKAF